MGMGEIVGVAGVDGSGQRELSEALVGLRRAESGKLFLAGREITRLSVSAAAGTWNRVYPRRPASRGHDLRFQRGGKTTCWAISANRRGAAERFFPCPM